MIVKFEVTNPYDKEYIVPIPNYYYVRSNSVNFKSLPKVNYDRKKNDYYYFMNQLNDKNGEWIIKKSDVGGIKFSFKAKESKIFQVKFKPVTKEVNQLVFGGINSEFQKYDHKTNSSNIKEVWFILDLENNIVINKYYEGGYKLH